MGNKILIVKENKSPSKNWKSQRPRTQGDWTQIVPTIPIGLPYEDGLRTVMGVKY